VIKVLEMKKTMLNAAILTVNFFTHICVITGRKTFKGLKTNIFTAPFICIKNAQNIGDFY
jgi:hypothetical protein